MSRNTDSTADWPEIERLDPATGVDVTPSGGWYPFAKTVTDYGLAVLMLVPALPIIFAAWAAIKITSPGPGFYSQTRLGRNGRPYRIIKIRSMSIDAEAAGVQWAQKRDARVTKVGQFLRATHLDELPQLFNVLMGQMSLVGPRPERPEMIDKKGLNRLIPGYTHRLLVKPGVTGLAQVQLPADTDLNSVRHKVVYDLFYIESAGPMLDIRIILATLAKTTGMKPKWLRRLFLLPSRDAVVRRFTENLTADDHSNTYPRLQPA